MTCESPYPWDDRLHGTRRKPCSVAHCNGYAVALCDFALSGRAKGRTCDRALCEAHRARQPGKDVDYCPTHAAMAPKPQTSLFETEPKP